VSVWKNATRATLEKRSLCQCCSVSSCWRRIIGSDEFPRLAIQHYLDIVVPAIAAETDEDRFSDTGFLKIRNSRREGHPALERRRMLSCSRYPFFLRHTDAFRFAGSKRIARFPLA